MRAQRVIDRWRDSALAGSLAFAQVGRGGSQWLTALADAQRTSWVRSDDKISVAALSKPGFELQWTTKLENRPRGVHGLGQGVTASGVTLFVPMSLVTGSSNNVYGIDNDLGYVVWERQFDVALPAATAGCPGGISAGATRIVQARRNGRRRFARVRRRAWRGRLSQPARRARARRAGRRAGRWPAGAAPAPPRRGGARRLVAVRAPPHLRRRQVPAGRGGPPDDRIPGSPPRRGGAQSDASVDPPASAT